LVEPAHRPTLLNPGRGCTPTAEIRNLKRICGKNCKHQAYWYQYCLLIAQE
jgi:hypothetical protein